MEPRRWRKTVSTGLTWGAAAIFISLVGLVEAVQQRQIVAGVISSGHALLLLIALGAGVQGGRRHLGLGAARIVAGGALAGIITGLLAAVLVAAGTGINLRAMFNSASPGLFAILSFGRGTAALPWMVLAGAVAGAVGALTIQIPTVVRGLLTSGITTLIVIGFLQDLIQLLLQSPRVAPVRDLLFTFEGLSVRGAAIVFLAAVASSVLWRRERPRTRERLAALAPPQRRVMQGAGFIGAIGLILVLPLVAGPFLSQVLVFVGLYTLMGLGLNLEIGFAGLLDLGFAAFFAIGAYTTGLLSSTGPLAVAQFSWWTAMLIAVAVSLLAGVFFGVPVLGIRGDYLAIATLGFGEIIRLMVLSDFLRPWLGGSQGLLSIPKPMLFGFEFRGPEQLFFIAVGLSAVVAFIAARLRDSRLGRAWMALREDEDVAQAMGINLVNIKLLAYGIGAAFAGAGGAIFAVMVGSVFPHSFSVLVSINVLSLIIVGGMGSLPGVMVGALALVGLPELLREFSDFRFLVYGAVLILMMVSKPEGLWPAAAQRRELHAEVDRVPASVVEAPEGGEV